MTTDTLPSTIISPSAWIGKDLRQRENEWLVNLSNDHINELERAAEFYKTLGLDIAKITTDTFPLPKFSTHLGALKEKLLHGIGVEVLRGLPVANYSRETTAIIFCGIGAHLGSARCQNAAGHILGHVRDIGSDPNDPNTRIYQTNSRQTFHTDSADVVGLLCIKDAKWGGHSLLVSAESIYNVIYEKRPDLLPLLFKPMATDRRGEVPEGMQPFMTIPPLSWHDGKLTVFYQRQYIDSAQRFPDALALTKPDIEALDYFDAVANDPSLHLQMHLKPGDMQFVYNHSQLHDRTEFQDWPQKKDRRHLLRLWLSLKGDRNLPECFKQRYGSIEIGDRGGIITNNIELSAPIT